MQAHRPRRFKTVTRWACTVMAAVVLIVQGASSRWLPWWCSAGPDPYCAVVILDGRLAIASLKPKPFLGPGWHLDRVNPGSWTLQNWLFTYEPIPGGYAQVLIPLWAPFLASALPAVLLWRMHIRDRRLARAGSCPRCGYDRRGLANSAICPECAAPGPV